MKRAIVAYSRLKFPNIAELKEESSFKDFTLSKQLADLRLEDDKQRVGKVLLFNQKIK